MAFNQKVRSVTLPQELYDQIMFYLWGDIISLKNCSLVCKSWVVPSRAPLFRTLSIGESVINAALLPLTKESTWPAIASYVKKLQIPGMTLPKEIPSDSLLRTISSNLTYLHLSKSFSGDFEGLTAVVCMFFRLQILVMDGVHWNESRSAESQSSTNKFLPQSLFHVKLRNVVSLSPLMHWLLSQPQIPTVTHLDIGPIKDHEIPFFGRFLTKIAANLEYLALSFECHDTGTLWSHGVQIIEPEQIIRRPERPASEVARLYRQLFGLPTYEDMCSLSRLCTLRVNKFLDISLHDQSAAQFWTPRILTIIQSPNIANIILEINISRAGDLDKYNINWNFIDQALSTKTFRTLHALQFIISGKVNLEAISSLLSSRLPSLANRNLLRFSKTRI